MLSKIDKVKQRHNCPTGGGQMLTVQWGRNNVCGTGIADRGTRIGIPGWGDRDGRISSPQKRQLCAASASQVLWLSWPRAFRDQSDPPCRPLWLQWCASWKLPTALETADLGTPCCAGLKTTFENGPLEARPPVWAKARPAKPFCGLSRACETGVSAWPPDPAHDSNWPKCICTCFTDLI